MRHSHPEINAKKPETLQAFPAGKINKAKLIRTMPGFRIFKKSGVFQIRIGADNDQKRIAVQIHMFCIECAGRFYGNFLARKSDRKPKRLLDIFVQGVLCNFRGKTWNDSRIEIIPVFNNPFLVIGANAYDLDGFRSFGHGQLFENDGIVGQAELDDVGFNFLTGMRSEFLERD